MVPAPARHPALRFTIGRPLGEGGAGPAPRYKRRGLGGRALSASARQVPNVGGRGEGGRKGGGAEGRGRGRARGRRAGRAGARAALVAVLAVLAVLARAVLLGARQQHSAAARSTGVHGDARSAPAAGRPLKTALSSPPSVLRLSPPLPFPLPPPSPPPFPPQTPSFLKFFIFFFFAFWSLFLYIYLSIFNLLFWICTHTHSHTHTQPTKQPNPPPPNRPKSPPHALPLCTVWMRPGLRGESRC